MNLSGLRFSKPDFRDFNVETPQILTAIGGRMPSVSQIPLVIDLTDWFSPLENQDRIGACSAHAGVNLFEYYDRRTFGKRYTDLSRMFLYKVTRNLMGVTGDTGADMRTMMRACARVGLPPEKYWPYIVDKFDVEPSNFVYSLASNNRAEFYVRLDNDMNTESTLYRVKSFASIGLPSCFGFICYESLDNVGSNGNVPFPTPGEKMVGAHAIDVAGFDDNRVITHPKTGKTTVGAIKFPNSWGLDWGEKGWGWLPYEYILQGQAFDFWALLRTSAPKFLDWD